MRVWRAWTEVDLEVFGRAMLFGFLAIGLWASLAVLTTAAAGIPPFELLALTFSLAGGVGCAWLLRRGRAGVAALRQPAGAAALSISALGGYHSLYFIAFSRAPAVEVNLAHYILAFADCGFRRTVAGRAGLRAAMGRHLAAPCRSGIGG